MGAGSCMTRLNRVEDWGVTGWSDEFGPLANDDDAAPLLTEAYGFERILDPGMIYRPQPDIGGVPRWIGKPGTQGRVFQMGWPEADAPTTQSLLDLHAAIAGRRRELEAGDAALVKLDDAIGTLVDIAGALHGQQATVGFLQPDSVRVGTRHDGSTFVVLPDVGFAWDDTGGLYEPDWLAEPQAELVFDRGARARNTEYVALLKKPADERDLRQRARDSGAAEAADVRVVARLIALALAGQPEVTRWCGAAKSLQRLPGKDVAPDTAAPIWDQVIAPALEGRIPTFAELRLRLSAAKPSEHFLYEPPAPPWAGWAALRRAGIAAAAVTLLAGLWWLKGILFPPRVYAPFCRQVAESEPLYGSLQELEKLEGESQVDAAKRADFWKQLLACRAGHAELNRCRTDCLEKPTETYLAMVLADGETLLARLRATPRPGSEERRDIEAAIASIGAVTAELKRDAEPPVVKKLARQLTLRGGAAPKPTAQPAAEAGP